VELGSQRTGSMTVQFAHGGITAGSVIDARAYPRHDTECAHRPAFLAGPPRSRVRLAAAEVGAPRRPRASRARSWVAGAPAWERGPSKECQPARLG
jgi:hypothetical protein